MTYERLLVERKAPYAIITLHEPDKRNPFSPTLVREMTEALNAFAADDEVLVAHAPCSGRVAKLFPGGHGVAIESAAGAILLHLGLDTVALKGAGLSARVGDGDRIEVGQPLVELQAAHIRAGGTSLLTPIVAIEGQRVELLVPEGGQVQAGDPLLSVYPSASQGI